MKYGTSRPRDPQASMASAAADNPKAYKLGSARLARISHNEPAKTPASSAASNQPPVLLTSKGMGPVKSNTPGSNTTHRPVSPATDSPHARINASREVPR